MTTFVEPVKEYRFVLVLRGDGLVDGLTETDPQVVGKPPLPVEPLRPEAGSTAKLLNKWLAEARKIPGWEGGPEYAPHPVRVEAVDPEDEILY